MKPHATSVTRMVRAAFRSHFNEASKVLTTPRAKVGAAKDMETLHCSECGARIGVVTDRRFGLMPSGSVCVSCSAPAYRRLRRVSTL